MTRQLVMQSQVTDGIIKVTVPYSNASIKQLLVLGVQGVLETLVMLACVEDSSAHLERCVIHLEMLDTHGYRYKVNVCAKHKMCKA